LSFSVIIPARYASTRLPGKPLLDIAGQSMIERVYRQALASGAERIVVATDDVRIQEAVTAFGGEVCMTAATHNSGSERLAEAAVIMGLADDEIVVNLQGDEPLMPPELLHQVADLLGAETGKDNGADVATLSTRIHTIDELYDPHVVKVVTDACGFALYFSRAVIPWDRDHFAHECQGESTLPERFSYQRHLGIYAYRVGYIKQFVAQQSCLLEEVESLEQLRVLWSGGKIKLAVAQCAPSHGIDTPQDLARVIAALS
jgi:3-deoxy-manno-octulosonate cytidylyltransferase (CMP-KDO synthetase)